MRRNRLRKDRLADLCRAIIVTVKGMPYGATFGYPGEAVDFPVRCPRCGYLMLVEVTRGMGVPDQVPVAWAGVNCFECHARFELRTLDDQFAFAIDYGRVRLAVSRPT